MNTEQYVTLALVGPSGGGKTCLFRRFFTLPFGVYPQTPDICSKQLPGADFRVRVWDTVGHPIDFRTMHLLPSFLHRANGILLVFDLTESNSFDQMQQWVDAIQKTCSNAEILLVGNKCEDHTKRAIEYATINCFVGRNNIKGYVECSAKQNQNVEDAFEQLAWRARDKLMPPVLKDGKFNLIFGGEDTDCFSPLCYGCF